MKLSKKILWIFFFFSWKWETKFSKILVQKNDNNRTIDICLFFNVIKILWKWNTNENSTPEKGTRDTEARLRNTRKISFVSAHGVVLIWNRPSVNDGRTLFSNSSNFTSLSLSFSYLASKPSSIFDTRELKAAISRTIAAGTRFPIWVDDRRVRSAIFFSCCFRANWRWWHPVCIAETRVMKNEERGCARKKKTKKKIEKRKKTDEEKEKRSKYIDSGCAAAPGNPLRKIGHIDQTGFHSATDRPALRPSSARIGNV